MSEFGFYLTKLGLAIKKQREFQNFTQEQIIEKVHQLEFNSESKRQLAQETLSRIENGRFNPSMKQIYLISRALDMSPADLLFLCQNMEV